MPVFPDENGRKTYYASFRYTDWTGKRRTHKKRGFAKVKDAKEYEREFLRKAGQSTDMTFASLVALYREDKKNRHRDTTSETKRSIVDTHLLPDLGALKVSEITPATIRNWQNKLLDLRKPNGDKYAPTYLRSINTQLSTILNFAVKFHGLPSNPCHVAEAIGKKKAPEMKFWTVDEFNQAMTGVAEWGKRLAFQIMFWTGCRVSECLALTPADITPAKLLRVEKSFLRIDGEDAAGLTKTENSIREISMPEFLYDETQRYIGALYGICSEDRIFYFTRGTLNWTLTKAADQTGVKRIRVHDLRHSHAALLVELKYTPNMIAERLGDTVAVAMATYSHLYPSKQDELAAELNRHQHGIAAELAAVAQAPEAAAEPALDGES